MAPRLTDVEMRRYWVRKALWDSRESKAHDLVFNQRGWLTAYNLRNVIQNLGGPNLTHGQVCAALRARENVERRVAGGSYGITYYRWVFPATPPSSGVAKPEAPNPTQTPREVP